MSGRIEPSVPQQRFLHKAPGPCLSPGSEHVARLLDGGDDAADVFDRALDEEVDARRELMLVRNEDLEAVDAQRGGALVDERALVRREQRTGEVNPQSADVTDLQPAFWQVQQSHCG